MGPRQADDPASGASQGGGPLKHKNLKLQLGSLVWLNKRATNPLYRDMVVARKLAMQWSGPFIYLQTINAWRDL